MFGRVQEFDSKEEEWRQYSERLNHFFAANKITNASRKRDIFFTAVGAKTYKLLGDLVAPAKPGEKSYAELADTLENHFSPKPSEIVQRFHFHSHHRRQEESVATFLAELRSL